MMNVDVAIIGAGHNGLVAAILLARAGLNVTVVERFDVLGGAVRTEYPFRRAPELPQSTGAYLLGLMPPELIETLGIKLPLMRRDPHYFLPTTSNGYLLFGSNNDAMREQFLKFFSAQDLQAYDQMQAQLAAFREDLGPTWLQGPCPVEEVAGRFIRSELQESFLSLVQGSIGDWLARFSFESELVMAMFAVTDAFSGSSGGWDTPGSGMNFLVHNMCRLPEADGTWMVVQGGMGTVTSTLAEMARAEGVTILAASPVAMVESVEGKVEGLTLENGERIQTSTVLANCDPFTLSTLVGPSRLPRTFVQMLDDRKRDGTTLKVNLALSGLPNFTCLPDQVGQHRGTIHLLPQDEVLANIRKAHRQAMGGQLPDFPTIEWYIQTTVDEALTDPQGRLSSALFVQWVPRILAEGSWEDSIDDYVTTLLGICDAFAPGTSALVDDVFALHPQAIEEHFGIRYGHIHHVDNLFGFDQRIPYRWPVDGLYSCSAGCHPAGSVIGASGHNAAMEILADLGRLPARPS